MDGEKPAFEYSRTEAEASGNRGRSPSISASSIRAHVDLMVKDGFYSNRTDFIRTAIRNQLERHADVVNNLPPVKAWISASGITRARISKRRSEPARCCTSDVLSLASIAQAVKAEHASLLPARFPCSKIPCHPRGQGRLADRTR